MSGHTMEIRIMKKNAVTNVGEIGQLQSKNHFVFIVGESRNRKGPPCDYGQYDIV